MKDKDLRVLLREYPNQPGLDPTNFPSGDINAQVTIPLFGLSDSEK